MSYTQITKQSGVIPKVGFQRIAVVILLSLFFLMTRISAQHLTLTYDESFHYQYGLQILNLNSDRFDDSKMPFSVLNALPGKLASYLSFGELRSRMENITTGRIGTMLFSVFTAFVIFLWSKKLYSFLPTLLPLLLYTWDPNIIAHSQLVTTDIYAVGMMTVSIFVLWRFSDNRDWKHAFLLATVLGLSQLAKYTSIFLYPISAVMIILRDSPGLLHMITTRDLRSLWKYIKQMLLYGFLVIIMGLLIINTGFVFNRTGTLLSKYKFRSNDFQLIQHAVLSIADIPLPTPYPFLQGLDDVRSRERSGRGFGRIYLLGELRIDGFTGYYFFAYLFKTPIASQLIFLLAIGVYIRRRNFRQFLKRELFLLFPILFFTIYFNFFYRAQIGIRYFLVVLPFMYIFSGNLLEGWHAFRFRSKVALVSLVGFLFVSVLSYFPHYIPYFNEFVPDRRFAYKILADSNLDWGQADGYAKKYVEEHPETLIELSQPQSGKILVRANDLVGITADPKTYQWLRDYFVPDKTVAYAYLLYNVSPEQLDQVKDLFK